MRLRFNPDAASLDVWLNYYGDQASQVGYGIEGFEGTPWHRGAGLGSFFRSLFRMAVPVIKRAASTVGRQAIKTGANIAGDWAKGRALGESFQEHGKASADELLRKAQEALHAAEEAKANGTTNGIPNGIHEGHGLGYRPTQKSINTAQKSINTTSKFGIFNDKLKQENVSHRYKLPSKYKK